MFLVAVAKHDEVEEAPAHRHFGGGSEQVFNDDLGGG